MIVRKATLNDLSEIVAFGRRMIEQTNYAPFGYNAVIARRTAKEAMTRPDSRVWVAERDGAICGLLIGEIGAMPFSAHMAATDLVFVAEAGGDMLLDAFVEWCRLCKVARIDMGLSAGPMREEAVRRMFEAKGFVYSGAMFHKSLLGGTGMESSHVGA